MVDLLDIRDERRCELAVCGLLPIDSLKDRVLLDLIESSTESWILNKYCLEQAADEARDTWCISCLTVDHIIIDLLRVVIMERRPSGYNLTDENT